MHDLSLAAAAPIAAAEMRAPDWRTQPRASVVIVNYNGKQDLGRCLRSIAADRRPDYEIIVVDNASSDGSAQYVEEHFPDVRLVRSLSNGGYAGGNNLGARLARGRYLAFLNPDTVVEPGWLEALVSALEQKPDAGLVTSQIRLLGQPGLLNTCGADMHTTGITLCRGMGMDSSCYSEAEEVSAISGAAFALRRDLFLELGGLDEAFFMYMEDTELSWRARLAGYRCLYVPQSVVHHDYRLRFGPDKTFFQERNRYLMLLKALRWRTLLVLAPALVLSEMVTWTFVLLRERHRWRNKVRAYGWVAANWRWLMSSRRRTQALRQVPDRQLLAGSTPRLAYEQTGPGHVAHVAHLLLDPMFAALHWLALVAVRW